MYDQVRNTTHGQSFDATSSVCGQSNEVGTCVGGQGFMPDAADKSFATRVSTVYPRRRRGRGEPFEITHAPQFSARQQSFRGLPEPRPYAGKPL